MPANGNIKHIVVLLMENRSFDLSHEIPLYKKTRSYLP